jgi:hypothetical protein
MPARFVTIEQGLNGLHGPQEAPVRRLDGQNAPEVAMSAAALVDGCWGDSHALGNLFRSEETRGTHDLLLGK